MSSRIKKITIIEIEYGKIPVEYPNWGQPNDWQPTWPNVLGSRCSKCGLKLEGVMGYVCSTPGCPTGLGSPYCGVDSRGYGTYSVDMSTLTRNDPF